jgi:hypothetical protein
VLLICGELATFWKPPFLPSYLLKKDPTCLSHESDAQGRMLLILHEQRYRNRSVFVNCFSSCDHIFRHLRLWIRCKKYYEAGQQKNSEALQQKRFEAGQEV